ncbi:hypothetical protein ACPZ19_19065 [Amycolatopsis lurida]
MLDKLPYLAHAPQHLLRELFDAIQLTVRLRGEGDEATITIKLPAEQLPEIAHAAERIYETMPSTQKPPVKMTDGACVDAERTPDGIPAATTTR